MIAAIRPEAGAGTVQGTRRAANQDRHAILASGQLVILADGLAGRGDGSLASRAAVGAVRDYFCGVDSALRYPDASGSDLALLDARVVAQHLRSAFALAHAAVVRAAGSDAKPIATSLLVAVLLDEQLVVAHAGDCRAYRLRHHVLAQLTRDHRAYPPELSALSASEVAAVRPLVCIVERLLGGTHAPDCEITTEGIEQGDTLLLCSNGLSDALPRWVMAEILIEHADAKSACHRLLQAAGHAGAEDDATAVVVRLHPAWPVGASRMQPSYGLNDGAGP